MPSLQLQRVISTVRELGLGTSGTVLICCFNRGDIAYCGDGGGEADSDGGGESEGSAATTAGYRGSGGGGDEDDSKGNSGEKRGTRRQQRRQRLSSLSYFLFFWSGSGHGHEVRFFARYNCHVITHKPQYACTRDLAYFVR